MRERKKSILRVLLFVLLMLAACLTSPEKRAANHSRRGDQFAEQKKYREAVIEYKNAVDALPENPDLRWKLASAALNAKDFRTAMSELQRVVELAPYNTDAKGKLGEMYLAMRNTDEARKIADELVAALPDDPQGYTLQSGVLLLGGNIEGAIGKMKRAADLAPDSAEIMLKMGNLSVVKGDKKRAASWYDRALKANPGSIEVRLTRGNFFFATNKFDEGEKEYREAVLLSENNENIRLSLVQQYFLYGKGEEAERELKEIVGESNSIRARKILAQVKIESGSIEEAKGLVKEILAQDKNDTDGQFFNGRIALAENRLGDAKVILGQVVRKEPDNASVRLYNGLTEIKLGNVEAGKKEIREAIKLDPDNLRAHLVLGDIYMKSNAPELAEKEAIEVLRRNPTSIEASIIYADSFLLRKEWEKAEQVYRAMIKQLPDSPQGYFKMGVSKKLQGDKQKALNYFAQAFERSPASLNIINEYLFALVSANRRTRAESVMADLLKKDENNPLLWEMKGRLDMSLEKEKNAEEDFQRAIELAPDFSRARYELGVLYVRQKRFVDASDAFNSVLEKNRNNIDAHLMLGMVHQHLGKIDDSNTHYRAVLDLNPRNALAANNLASNLVDYGGNLDEALKFARMARETAPADPSVADTLGWIYFKKGLVNSAMPLIEDAAKKLPDNPVVRYHYGAVLAALGKHREAKKELAAALKINADFHGAADAKKIFEGLK